MDNMDNYSASQAFEVLEQVKAENAKLRDLLVRQVGKLIFPPVSETQIQLSSAICILNTIPKRSKYYNNVQKAIGIIKNATSTIPRRSDTSNA